MLDPCRPQSRLRDGQSLSSQSPLKTKRNPLIALTSYRPCLESRNGLSSWPGLSDTSARLPPLTSPVRVPLLRPHKQGSCTRKGHRRQAICTLGLCFFLRSWNSDSTSLPGTTVTLSPFGSLPLYSKDRGVVPPSGNANDTRQIRVNAVPLWRRFRDGQPQARSSGSSLPFPTKSRLPQRARSARLFAIYVSLRGESDPRKTTTRPLGTSHAPPRWRPSSSPYPRFISHRMKID